MTHRLLKRFDYRLILGIILILSAILRFYGLDFQSPWLDEIHTLNESNPNHSFLDLYTIVTRSEQLPPLYFYILYFAFKIFGYSIAVARGFSALLGVITVYSCFLLTKELINKRTALVAALILCINYYMIYYSQEARPYMLFTLFIVLSFYRMALFMKSHSVKNAIWFGVVACLMIHSHVVGFFTLFAQFITLLLYFILKEGVNRKQLFKGGVISAVVLLILYIPAVDALLSLFEIKSFWLRPPTADALSLIYNSFFGKSEIINFLNSIFFIGFLYWLVHVGKSNTQNKKEKLPDVWVSIVLILWISLTVLIPLIRTYISVPMILGRYMIAVLPAIIIMLAIGVTRIKNNFLTISLIAVYTVFSLTHLLFINDYYSSVKKAQFRETTSFIMANNLKNDKVVTSLPQYLPYFFKKEEKNYKIINSNLDAFVAKQIKNREAIESFWYFDGHNRKDNPKEETLKFLKNNYIVQKNFIGFQAFTRYYEVAGESNTKVEFNETQWNQLTKESQLMSGIEKFRFSQNHLEVKGWSFLKDLDSKNTKIKLMLLNDKTGYFIESTRKRRPDVTKFYKLKYDANNSGFTIDTSLNYIPKGTYQLGIWLENEDEKGLYLHKEIIKIQ